MNDLEQGEKEMKTPKIHVTKTNGRLYIRADSAVDVLKFIKSHWSEKEGREAVKKKLLSEGAVNEKNAKDVADIVCDNFRSAISIAIKEFKSIEAQAYEEEEEE